MIFGPAHLSGAVRKATVLRTVERHRSIHTVCIVKTVVLLDLDGVYFSPHAVKAIAVLDFETTAHYIHPQGLVGPVSFR